MSLGGRKACREKVRQPARASHGPRCPLNPANFERHTVLDRRRMRCTCEWDAAHGR